MCFIEYGLGMNRPRPVERRTSKMCVFQPSHKRPSFTIALRFLCVCAVFSYVLKVTLATVIAIVVVVVCGGASPIDLEHIRIRPLHR